MTGDKSLIKHGDITQKMLYDKIIILNKYGQRRQREERGETLNIEDLSQKRIVDHL